MPSTTQDVRRSITWLAALLGTDHMPDNYTVGLFHDGPTAIEHFNLNGRPINSDDAERVLTSIQFAALHHQVAHFADTTTDEEWETAMERVAALGDIGGNLTVQAMREGRTRLKETTGGGSLMAALAAALDGDIGTLRAAVSGDDGVALRNLLSGDVETSASPAREISPYL
jgi:hypothetical protein